MNKLWTKEANLNALVEAFTIGDDQETDLYLAKWDVIGSIAHVKMLQKVNLLNYSECEILCKELSQLLDLIASKQFCIKDGIEDVHSQVESYLVDKIGNIGKKIHTGRSRNDQVLLDLRLYMRDDLELVVKLMERLFNSYLSMSNKHKGVKLPGYTHMQIAMPSSFGLWFAAFAESLADDLILLKSGFDLVNKNPFGSAAGYGSSFPICRDATTKFLGFNDLNYNVVYAQWSRLKVETAIMNALSALASTISRFANDACLFMCANYGFISLPDEYTTGSSIMPHKKNPDVFEILRAKANDVKVHLFRLMSTPSNLTTGYFRDYQVLKKPLIDSFQLIKECLEISVLMVNKIQVNNKIMENEIYHQIYSVDEIDVEVRNGTSFRDAYNLVSERVKNNQLKPSNEVLHTLKGSKDNLCNDAISRNFYKIYHEFPFESIRKSYDELLTF